MLKILQAPSDVLATPSKEVEKIDDEVRKLVSQMTKTLVNQKDPEGAGLAAPQVNINLRIFIIKPRVNSKGEAFINPKIIDFEEAKEDKNKKINRLEGCLSISRIWGPVKRHKRVKVEYLDTDGKVKTQWFSGLKSIIVQHEIDHLNGILFTQRVLEQNGHLYEEKGKKLVRKSF